MELKNYTECIVREILAEVVASTDLAVCRCERCRLDIAAKALNNLAPHYIVSHKGEIYTKLSFSYNEMRVKVLAEVMNAIIQVASNPSHELAAEKA